MSTASNIRVGLSIPVGAIFLAIAVLWKHYPPPSEPCFVAGIPLDEQPYGLAHCYHDLSVAEQGLKVAIILLSLAATTTLASSAVDTRKIVTGASAAAGSALLGLFLVQVGISRAEPISLIPSADFAAIVCISSFVFGAAVSFGVSKWWPNTSLERTRER